MTPLAVFLSSFISVFALGFQSQNVNQGHYVAAFITSFAIGGGTLVLYKVLPDGTWLDTVAYLIGGATGIVCAMWAHRRTLGRKVATPPTAPEPDAEGWLDAFKQQPPRNVWVEGDDDVGLLPVRFDGVCWHSTKGHITGIYRWRYVPRQKPRTHTRSA